MRRHLSFSYDEHVCFLVFRFPELLHTPHCPAVLGKLAVDEAIQTITKQCLNARDFVSTLSKKWKLSFEWSLENLPSMVLMITGGSTQPLSLERLEATSGVLKGQIYLREYLVTEKSSIELLWFVDRTELSLWARKVPDQCESRQRWFSVPSSRRTGMTTKLLYKILVHSSVLLSGLRLITIDSDIEVSGVSIVARLILMWLQLQTWNLAKRPWNCANGIFF